MKNAYNLKNKQKRILFDLRFTDFGEAGGIENVAYYLIDCMLLSNYIIVLDVLKSSEKIFKLKYSNIHNVIIISDPIEGVYHQIKHVYFLKVLFRLFDKLAYELFNIELFRNRSRWANKINADLVFIPNHLGEIQQRKIPSIVFMHAILPNYTISDLKKIEKNASLAKYCISLWHYPFKEFIELFPEFKEKWFWIPMLVDQNLKLHGSGVDDLFIEEDFWLYMSFFTDRKNHITLIEGYYLANLKRNDLPHLYFVGKGDYKYFLRCEFLIKKFNLTEKIHMFYTYLPSEQVAQLYAQCLGVISSSIWEAASGTIVEAVQIGKPVLCSDVPPLTDFASSFDLKIEYFNPFNKIDISEKLLDFWDNRERYLFYGIENQFKIKKYDKKYTFNKILELLNTIL